MVSLLTLAGCLLLTPEDLAKRLAEDSGPAPDTETGLGDDTGDSSGMIDTGPCDVDTDGYDAESCGGTDCDDDDAAIHPGQVEGCDGVDQDCDGETDEDPPKGTAWYADADGDGQGDPDVSRAACSQPDGMVANNRDCDDTDAAVNTSATETCNGIDDDCSGGADGAYAVPSVYADLQDALDAAPDTAWVCVSTGTYRGNFVVNTSITLEGAGTDLVTLDGLDSGTVLTVGAGLPTVTGLTISGGNADTGAGLLVNGFGVILQDVVIEDNRCEATTCTGVGAALTGAVDLDSVTFRDNQASLVGSTQSLAQGVGLHGESVSGSWSNVNVTGNEVRFDTAGTLNVVYGVGVSLEDSAIDARDVSVRENVGEAIGTAAVAFDGGGIFLDGDDSTFADLAVTGNRVSTDHRSGWGVGAGLFVADSRSEFTRLEVVANDAEAVNVLGSAAYVYLDSAIEVTNARFLGNTAYSDSGLGTIAVGDGSLSVENADVVGNVLDGAAGAGGGFYVASTGTLVLNNTVVSGNEVSGDVGGAVSVLTGGAFTATWSDFFDNGATPFSGTTTPSSGDGNLDVDPLYTSVTGDATTWDLSLQAGSPLIDAGDPDLTDVDGSRSDMGGDGGGAGGAW